MTHPILSVKMYELDKKLEQTHSRIQFAETMDTEDCISRFRIFARNVQKAGSHWKTGCIIQRQDV